MIYLANLGTICIAQAGSVRLVAMEMFKDREDLEEWLSLQDYEKFWKETAIFALELQSKESCDRQIARGSIDQATVLSVLKGMARLELVQRFDLKPRDTAPWHSLH